MRANPAVARDGGPGKVAAVASDWGCAQALCIHRNNTAAPQEKMLEGLIATSKNQER